MNKLIQLLIISPNRWYDRLNSWRSGIGPALRFLIFLSIAIPIMFLPATTKVPILFLMILWRFSYFWYCEVLHPKYKTGRNKNV